MELTPKMELLGLTFDLTVLLGSLTAAFIVFMLTFLATRGLKMVPNRMQNLMEWIVEFGTNLTQMGFNDKKTAEKFLGSTLTLLLFILVANQMGVIMMVTSHGPVPSLGLTEDVMHKFNAHGVAWLKSPTADINVTIAMAVAVALFANLAGIFTNPKGFVKHFVNPMFLIHLMEEVTKPLTHAMRLWANIFAGEVLITILLTNGPIWLTGAPLLAWMGFSVFVGCIQAYIFTALANVYIGQKINFDHH